MKIQYAGKSSFTVLGETREDYVLISELVDDWERGRKLTIISSSYLLGGTRQFTFGLAPKEAENMTRQVQTWWGIYCPQHNIWMQDAEGKLYHYPSPEIAQAHIEHYQSEIALIGNYRYLPSHRWEVTEFGKQNHTPQNELPASTELCLVR